jgi:GNAT superfamily N-acetyltransferase
MPFMTERAEIEHALKVFVHGFCYEKSRTHPYEYFRVGKLWVMRDVERKNAKDYRKEEWIAYDVAPREVDAAARQGTRGRFFVCALCGPNDDEEALRSGYKAIGYRLLATETLFVQRLKAIPRRKASSAAGIAIDRVKTVEMAERFGKATRTRPIPREHLGTGAAFRQYVALEGDDLVGWVRSVNADDSTWCSNMHVRPAHRRRGIGRALLTRMLADDRRCGAKRSVLLSSHTGALLYPQVGYQPLGRLFIFAPRKLASRG